MFYWEVKVDEANLRQRIMRLPHPTAVVFVLGCLTHARDGVSSSHPVNVTETFLTATSLLDRFWEEYPLSLEFNHLAKFHNQALALIPDEDTSCPMGDDIFVAGLAHAFCFAQFKEFKEEAALSALTALDRAYIFVYTFYNERSCNFESEERSREAEKNCAACLAEIEFQLSFLATLERLPAFPIPRYEEVLKHMDTK